MGARHTDSSNASQDVDGPRTDIDDATKVAMGFSPLYHGDPYLRANMSANIPDELNCSLFIVNLPSNLTVHRLIIAIHGLGPLGRIFAIHINAPEPSRGHHGCAAKVVFFKRSVAHAFMDICQQRGFYVDGHQARVMWNRIRTAENPSLANSDVTRVLLIGGPSSFVNPASLTEYFRKRFDFQIDEVKTPINGAPGLAGQSVVEYRFGSYRCQAQAAKMALAREHPQIKCYHRPDPLDLERYDPFEYDRFPNAFTRM